MSQGVRNYAKASPRPKTKEIGPIRAKSTKTNQGEDIAFSKMSPRKVTRLEAQLVRVLLREKIVSHAKPNAK